MRTVDFAPLWRSTIGFDRLFDLMESTQGASEDTYPPYNIERLGDDRFQISLALAGFSPEDISITAEQNVLTVEGARKIGNDEREYLYRGIAQPAVQAPIQPCRLRAGSRCFLRQWPVEDRAGARNPRGDEAATDRHQRPVPGIHPKDRDRQGGLIRIPAARLRARGLSSTSS